MPVKTKRKSATLSTVLATARAMDKLVEKVAEGAAIQASQLAPRSQIDHVHMADVIKAKQEGRDKWRIVVDKAYAIYVELGTVFMDAIPFFRPAIASAQRALRRGLKIVKGQPRIR